MNHGIQEHLIILSVDEISRYNPIFSWLTTSSLQLLDSSVMTVNQIMYTFNKETINVINTKTRENWYWNPTTFQMINPLFIDEYKNSYSEMIYGEVTTHIRKFIWLTFTFGCISMINALFIRISIKCSVLMIFPMIAIQNRLSRRRINHVQQRLIY